MSETAGGEARPAPSDGGGGVRDIAWLVPEILVAMVDLADEGPPRAALEDRRGSESLPARYLPISDGDGEAAAETTGMLLVHVPEPLRSSLARRELVIEQGGAQLRVPGRMLVEAPRSIQDLLRRRLAPLPASERNRISHFAATAAPDLTVAGASTQRLGEALHALRGGLREHLRPAEDGERRGLGVEKLLAIDSSSFYAYGWIGDRDASIARVTAVSPEGERVDLSQRLFRYRRPDVAKLFGDERGASAGTGFAAYFQLSSPSHLSKGWVFEAENDRGDAIEHEVPEVVSGRSTVTAAILEDPYHQRVQDDELMERHVLPAVTRLQEQVEALVEVRSSDDFGAVPRSPEISIVVPLYRRIDLIEYQLARFADDPDLQRAELVYVLDSPEQREPLLALAGGLSEIYRVPFRVCSLAENVGFAGACNAGAARASGRLLVLLNSDVLPSKRGWLSALSAFCDRTPDLGALGPKLLYEDDTIQDAGMYLHRSPESTVWRDAHYFKCLHKSLPAANVARRVPAVSGACLMLERELYERVGGMRGIYVTGDYEDFDLCLRLAAAGRDCWYLPQVELYHLEALSYESAVRAHANRYNAWLHTHLWRDRIEELMRSHPGSDGSPAPEAVAGS